MYKVTPGPTSDAEIIRRMKDLYLQAHPECTDDDLDVKVEYLSRYHTNFTLVVKPKISGITIRTYIDNDKVDSKIG